jgi:hypothetical protein
MRAAATAAEVTAAEVTAPTAMAVIVRQPMNHAARPVTAGAARQATAADLEACRVMAAAEVATAVDRPTVAVRTARLVPAAVILQAAIPQAEGAAIPAAVAARVAILPAIITETNGYYRSEGRR